METIVDGVIKAEAMTGCTVACPQRRPLGSLAIPVSQGGQYRVTQAGVDAAHLLSQQSWKSREALRQTINQEAFMKALVPGHRGHASRLPIAPSNSTGQPEWA